MGTPGLHFVPISGAAPAFADLGSILSPELTLLSNLG